jgi:hypothetical protein
MLQVSGNHENIWYYKPEAKDANSNNWFFRVESDGDWRVAPTFSMRPSVYYVNTSNSSQRSQQVPSGDPVLPPVTIANYGNTNTEDIGAGMNMNYLASPVLTIGVNGNYSEQRFTGTTGPTDNTSVSGLTNSKSAGGNASVSYLISPRASLGIIVAGNHQTYDSNPDSNTLSGGIRFGYQFSEPFRVDGVFGMSYIRQSAAPGIPEERKSEPSGLFNATYVAETLTANVFGSAVYSGGSGYGQATRQYSAGLAFINQFSRDWSGTLSGTYQVSKSVFTSDAVNLKTIYGTGGISYKPWEWASLDLTGSLNRQTSDGASGSDLKSYAATLGFTISKAYKVF